MPPRRRDLTREADLIEELARLHGYQKIPIYAASAAIVGGRNDYRLGWERRTRSLLAGEGLVEVVNLPFTTEKLNRVFAGLWDGDASPVAVLNPIAKESAEMRLSLIPGLIENLRANLAQKAESFCAYHLGKVFASGPMARREERQCLAGSSMARERATRFASRQTKPALGFLDCKGLVEGILDLLHMDRAPWAGPGRRAAFLHPGRAAAVALAMTRNWAIWGRSIPMFATSWVCRLSCFSNLTSRDCFSMLRDE